MNVKGKGRAVDNARPDDEREPLLGSTSSQASQDVQTSESGTLVYPRTYDDNEITVLTRRQRWTAFFAQALKWLSVFVIIAFCTFMIFLAILWATVNSAPAARQQPDAIVAHATRWRTISIEVLGVKDGEIDVSVSGELGIDTEWILGVDPEDQSALAYARRATGRWLVRSLGGVRTTSPTTVSLYDHDGVFLVDCTTRSFSADVLPNNPHTREVRMAPIRIPFGITPTANSEDILRFANLTWLQSAARISAHAAEISVQAAKRPWWFPKVTTTARDVSTNIQIALPGVPKQYPQPGTPLDLSEVLSVGSYVVKVDEDEQPSKITFSALASLLLPFTSPSAAGIHLPVDIPSFSFLVSLPNPKTNNSLVPFANLYTTPELNTTAELASISFPITGYVLPIEAQTVPPLSALVSHYLSAQPSTIVIASSEPTDSSAFPFALPPTEVVFPGPPTKPKILQSVTIKDMKLGASPSGEELTASGTLIASFVLPAEIAGGKGGLSDRLNVKQLWPDALVFDGPPPADFISSPQEEADESRRTDDRPIPPLPVPLPPRAFARIRTPDWLEAQMLPDHEDDEGARPRWVMAKIVEAPLEVLPGRNNEFQAFLRKVLLSRGQGALAGVRGTTAIALRLDGLPLPRRPQQELAHQEDSQSPLANPSSERGLPDEDEEQDIELDGLAFEGTFVIGKKHVFHLAAASRIAGFVPIDNPEA